MSEKFKTFVPLKTKPKERPPKKYKVESYGRRLIKEFIMSGEKLGKVKIPPKKTITGVSRALGRLMKDDEFKGKVNYYISESNEIILQRL
jgi:hypothetical protein